MCRFDVLGLGMNCVFISNCYGLYNRFSFVFFYCFSVLFCLVLLHDYALIVLAILMCVSFPSFIDIIVVIESLKHRIPKSLGSFCGRRRSFDASFKRKNPCKMFIRIDSFALLCPYAGFERFNGKNTYQSGQKPLIIMV